MVDANEIFLFSTENFTTLRTNLDDSEPGHKVAISEETVQIILVCEYKFFIVYLEK